MTALRVYEWPTTEGWLDRAIGLSIARAMKASIKLSGRLAYIVLPHDLQLRLIESVFSH